MKTLFAKLVSHKGVYYLFLIAMLGLLLAADMKWSP